MNLGSVEGSRLRRSTETVTWAGRAVLRRTAAWILPLLLLVAGGRAHAGLGHVQTLKDSTPGVDGLSGAQSVVVSPDGAHVYVGGSGEDKLAVFTRSPSAGTLTFAQVVVNGGSIQGLDGVRAVAISPDGAHVYSAGYLQSTLGAFSRNPATGALSFVAAYADETGSITKLGGVGGVAVSPDGAHVYTASDTDAAVTVFSRNPSSGALTFVQAKANGDVGITSLAGAESVTVSPEGTHVYVAAEDANAVTVFSRDASSGQLTLVEVKQNGGGVSGLTRVQSVAVSADGAQVYTASGDDSAVVVFNRNTTTGVLTFVQKHTDGSPPITALGGTEWVAVNPLGVGVYAAADADNALVVFDRAATGTLAFAQQHLDGAPDGLAGAHGVAVSPNGAHVYVVGDQDHAIAVFVNLCGNGAFDAGEACDDGNRADGDCCSGRCANEPAGSPCAEEHPIPNPCTDDKCNGAGLCLHVDNTAPCDDGLFCTDNDTCQARVCQGQPRACAGAGDQCNSGVCDEMDDECVAQPLTNATPCDDGSLCTLTDTCQAGVCVGANPVVCTALDECHDAGACDPDTGLCSDPPKPDGTSCFEGDGDRCQNNEICIGGVCTGQDPVVCSALDQCHVAGVCDPATGLCSSPPAADGSPCDDGSLCTQTDLCLGGACVGANAVICTAQDQCHAVGACNPATGVCSNPAKPDGSTCTDGDQCTLADTCQAGACQSGSPVVCTAQDECHQAGVCNPLTGQCSHPAQPDGTACDDGDACTRADACSGGICTGGDPVVCTALDDCHEIGVCNPATGQCSQPPRADGAACDDGSACTPTDVCSAGVCTGQDPVVCTVLDDCHVLGACNPATGVCSNPPKADGTTCDDGDACTQTDSCIAGLCVGADPETCTALDGCHDVGVCDPGTGVCSNPPKADGTACDDGSACTTPGVCSAGACTGESPVVCTAQDQCHDVGVCDPATGLCSNPAKVDGTACDDGTACTLPDACIAGVCAGQNPVVCTAQDACHLAGVCDPATGLCANPAKPDGVMCDDGDACTQTDTCLAGLCVGGDPGTCTAQDQCHAVGVCDPATGLCSSPPRADGAACTDGTLCTQTDTCLGGLCVGANPVVCAAQDSCHAAGTCNPATGLCSNPLLLDGTLCDDGNPCTLTDTCQDGTCLGGNPVLCPAQDTCHFAGVCNPATGLCPLLPKPDGLPCNDGSQCTQVDSCQGGVCAGASPVICTALDGCHDAGVCDAATGLCSNPPKANGTACDDGDACTPTDACESGLCVGTNPATCTALDACHAAGVCDPVTGTCSNPPKADGTACDDGNLCTVGDVCIAGTCQVGSPVSCTGDACHDAGTCNPATGLCSHPPKADGTPCDDGNACTQTDACQAGTCTGANPVTCTAIDGCHLAGVCNPATGLCSTPQAPDGTSCNDGNLCTQTDTCDDGACAGGEPVACSAQDQCHLVGVCNPATGVCSNPPQANGAACSDGNLCTQSDACQAGACVGANPVVCAAQDQCHVAGTCDPATGACSNPAKADGTACNDGDLCTQADACVAGLCVGANPVGCTAQDQCHLVGICNPATGTCSNPAAPNGTTCNDGDVCTQTDTCLAGTCSGGDPVHCVAQDACHLAGVCNPATGACSNPPRADGAVCDDGNQCTQTDRCQAGVCVGTNAVVCTAQDQCHVAGTCNPATGACSNPAKADGAACNDNSLCTRADACLAGVCAGGDPVICTAQDQCHVTGVCDPATGVCSNPAAANGAACDDGNRCTQTDTCQAGTCIGANPVVCVAQDQCHVAGVCDSATGVCSNLAKADGTACDDASLCTATDLCMGGSCIGTNAVVCTAQDQCHVAGTCNPATGVCSNPPAANGVACNDGNLCTQADTCQAGTCTGANPVVCTAQGQCRLVGLCNPATGLCSNPAAANGTACDDANPCTQTDICQAGSCVGANPVVCTAQDQCHLAGVCNPGTGTCSNPPKVNGAACNDGNLCTQTDACQAGACVGASPVACTAQDQCHVAGTCNPATGLCSNPAATNGTPCSDGNLCTQTDTCVGGSCVGGNSVTCAAQDQCHLAGVCNPATGVCSNPPKPNGTACDDGSLCTRIDICLAGSCMGADPVVCTAQSQCHAAGACNPTTGVCSNPPLPNGSACSDGNPCTQSDICLSGACTGANPVVCAAQDQCHVAGACNPATGLCANPAAADGTTCNDANLCTRTDICLAGSCVGADPVTCTALGSCHMAGTCNPATGVCSNPPRPNSTPCDDGNFCTRQDTCVAGTCVGGDPVLCTAQDACHAAGVCNPGTGVCSNPAQSDGAPCDDGNLCTQGDTCLAGVCRAGSPVTCTPQDACHAAGVCDPGSGLCTNPPAVDGTPCDDGDRCTQTDTCNDGFCFGAAPVTCTAQNGCHVAGTCNPATGLCSNPPRADGTACDDGDLCTTVDRCTAGICVGQSPVVCTAQDQCHAVGTCDPATGLCSNPSRTNGTACDDGNLCTQSDVCQAGACVGANPVVCAPQDACHTPGTCDPATGLCTNPNAADGTACDDGDPCTRTDGCLAGFCVGANPVTCTAQDACHVAGVCDPAAGTCTNPPQANGTACDDGDRCTQSDACQAGACVGANPVVCAAQDQCHAAGTCDPATGGCSNPPKANGAACDDGNLCTQSDACQAGACVGANPVACAAQDQCHAAGMCDPATGACSNPPKANGTACDDGSRCTRMDLCIGGLCTGVDPVVCAAQDQCHLAGTCAPATGTCTNPVAANGTACNDGNLCTQSDACQAGACAGSPIVCAAQGACRVAGVCDPATGACTNPSAGNGTPCNDGNRCTQTDICVGGSCVGAEPVACTAADVCHLAGVCNPATGACSSPPVPNGRPCDDGNRCTQSDACEGGVCTGSAPVVCTALGQCRVAGTCDPATGSCSNPAVADGTACDDADLCTRADACAAGVCTGGNPVVCAAQDQCHAAGTCDPATGVCSNPLVTNGTPCDDGDPCTQTDLCMAGVCVGTNPLTCAAQDQCHVAGTCDPATGTCSNPRKADGTACDDGSLCTQSDACQAGVCVGASLVACAAQDQCHVAGTCDPATGTCSNPPKAGGTACDDGSLCTQSDACQAGVCMGASPVTCAAQDQCHVAGTCDPATGLCTNPPKANGTACDDGSRCTQSEACQAGVCVGTSPVTCAAQDQCHVAGTCDPATGLCTNPATANGTACDDGNRCTQADACQAGVCVGASPVVCAAQDQCHLAGTCDPATGLCTNPPAPGGTACNDGNHCTRTDICLVGACVGAAPVVCAAQGQCRAPGTCNPATGTCSNPPMANGTACDDGNACTQSDACLAGACVGANPVVCVAQGACRVAGTCNPLTGTCSNPPIANGTACDDGNACTRSDTCQAGTCVGADAVLCTAQDQCHVAGACNPATGTCSNPMQVNGMACEDGNPCTRTDTCQAGACVGGSPVVCAAQDQCHVAGTCDLATGLCSNPAKLDGAVCGDGNACTRSDTCQAGACVGADPVICAAQDQCHVAGTCAAATGLCTNPAKANGAACDDGNACSRSDTCQAGACVGADPVLCAAQDQCHVAGTCNAATGLCTNPAKANGAACDDGNRCTQADTCQAGACSGAAPVVCAAQDTCHLAGACDPVTGLCSNPAKADGTACDDGNRCTQGDTCTAGACAGGASVTCTAADPCHFVGSCNPQTGLCSHPTAPDGAACDDDDVCTRSDACQAGVCVGANPVVCTAADQCHDGGLCDPETGGCSGPARPDGTPCDDGNLCTRSDACLAGVCVGANPVVCTAADQCHEGGVCDPATGACSGPAKPDGTTCDDGDRCTHTDTCLAGTCAGIAVTCAGPDACHLAGICDPATGVCSGQVKPDGTACDDGNRCTQADTCVAGMCVGASPVVCVAQDGCHLAGTCAPATGLCSSPPKANGTACDDGSACTQTDACQAGACVGASPVVCAAQDQCHVAGTCDPATGLCTNPVKADGTACTDANACTQTDTCVAGACVGASPVACAAQDQCHVAGTCNPATGVCTSPAKPDGTTCNDGNACTQADACVGGGCAGTNPVTCSAESACRLAGVCDPATGQCSASAKPDSTACDDGDLCTRHDACQAGACLGSDPVVCSAGDQCREGGVCDPATGVCSGPAKPDGTPCDDGNRCTQADTCVAGACAGDPVVCVATDQCHDPGVCDPATGLCSDPVAPDGLLIGFGAAADAHTDSDLPTTNFGADPGLHLDRNPRKRIYLRFTVTGIGTLPIHSAVLRLRVASSQSAGSDDGGELYAVNSTTWDEFTITHDTRPAVDGGLLALAGPVIPDQLLELDVTAAIGGDGVYSFALEPISGNMAVYRSREAGEGQPELVILAGTACDDADRCTGDDVCRGGVCAGTHSIVCPGPSAPCRAAGVCDPATGLCSDPPAADGTPCDDGNACTQVDSCITGTCAGADAVLCPAPDVCHDAGTCNPATGACSNPVKADGASCDDGDLCTRSDTCQAGMCVGANPIECTAADQCHDGGVCDPATGVCSGPPKANGTACDDGNLCTRSDSCQAGVCVGADAVVCTAADQCHDGGVCNPATGVCSGPAKTDGTACDDGDRCTQADACAAGVCVGAPVVCAGPEGCRLAGVCDPATGLCSGPPKADGTACDDGNRCTQTDTCVAGACVGANAVVCTAAGQCRVAGTCNPATGLCSDPPAANGTACNDGNQCTQTDTCVAGACVGANAVVCTAADQCHLAGTCNPATGSCSSPAKANGTVCDDGNACMQTDTCVAGACVGANAVVCTAADQCHLAGTCNPATGSCSSPAKANGTACDDGDRCTGTDACVAGVCVGTPVVCAGPDSCHLAGTCDPATGLCSGSPKPDGTPCDDGNRCTQADACVAGTCFGASPVVCAASDQCHVTGTCNPATGLCSNPPAGDGTPCDDGSRCTQTDVCIAGACAGGNPVVCAPQDSCHSAGTCDPATGACSHPMQANGTPCDDGNRCTQTDVCIAGVCAGGNPVTCTAPDQCHSAGSCDPATGTCSHPARPDGSVCDDGNRCTQTDTCAAGVCVGTAPVSCAAPDQCHSAGTCDPATGTCSRPARADGTACDDGDRCTQSDTCEAGLCIGANPVACAAPHACHGAGTCDPATGTCASPAMPDGTVCDDGNRCTRADECRSGSCIGGDPVSCGAPEQCHAASACDPATGACNSGPAADGTPCDDGNRCTRADECRSGICTGGDPVSCGAPDECHSVGTCDPATGTCASPPAADGTPCSDGDACSQTDTCQAGVCTGADRVACEPQDTCHGPGSCDPGTGTCTNPPLADGTPCDDGSFCSVEDACLGGVCRGRPRDCAGQAPQCRETACDPAAAACVVRPSADGTPCDDADLCTKLDRCEGGVCVGGDLMVCKPQDGCHAAGQCDPATGECTNPVAVDGTVCDDDDACTEGDLCFAGVCLGETLPDSDADGFCDAADVCPHIPDPGQSDLDGDGVGDFCQCTAPAPGRCIAGGGSRRTDCLVEFLTTGPVTLNRAGTRLKQMVRCADGDPRCDLDHARDGRCTFGVAVCFGNTDPRFPRCSPDRVFGIEIVRPQMSRGATADDAANLGGLEEALGVLGLEIRRRGAVVQSYAAAAGTNQCSPLVRLVTRAPAAAGGKSVRQKFMFRSTSMFGRSDRDRFTTVCE